MLCVCVCLCYSKTFLSLTQSPAGVVLCLTSTLAPPTATPLQPSDRPISQLFRLTVCAYMFGVCVHGIQVDTLVPETLRWCKHGCWAAVFISSLQALPLFFHSVLNPFCIVLSFFPLKHWLCVQIHSHACVHCCTWFGALIKLLKSILSWAVSHESVCACVGGVCVMANVGGLVHRPGGPSWSASPSQTVGWLMECKWWIIEQGNDKVGLRSRKNLAGDLESISMFVSVEVHQGVYGDKPITRGLKKAMAL